jgi:hypothetical protein
MPAALAAAFIAAPTVALTLAECFFWDIHRLILMKSDGFAGYLVWLPIGLTTILLSGVAITALRYRKDGVLTLLAGCAVAYFCSFNLRGSMIWPGLFDLATLARTPLHFSVAVGMFFGLLGLTFSRPTATGSRAIFKVLVGVSLLATAWTWWHATAGIGAYSVFAYSRHVAQTILLVVPVCIYFACPDERFE